MSNALKDKLNRTSDLFEQATDLQEAEPGFEYEDLERGTKQLRKACRSLDLVSRLLDESGHSDVGPKKYYTAAIEACFNATERSAQAALYYAKLIPRDAYPGDHIEVIKKSAQTGLWDRDDADAAATLYKDNRSEIYYRDGYATRDRALAMVEVAAEFHRLVVNSAKTPGGACICNRK